MYSEKQISYCKELIKKVFKENLNEIILFGSYSNNTANDNSDLDIAIIIQNQIDRKTKLDYLNQLWWESSSNGVTVDYILKSQNDYNSEKFLPSISRTISNEGKTLWLKK